MRLIHTTLADIDDPDVNELIQELITLRPDSISDEVLLLHFLHLFFLPGKQRRFVPIRARELFLQRWLLVKVSETRGTRIYELIRELCLISNNGMDTAANPKIYMALNSLLKPICKTILKKHAIRK